jgi:isoamylase
MTLTLGVTASSRWAAAEGLPCPLGATRIEEEDACNFALYSKHAQSVTLLLYTENEIVNPILAYRFDYLKNKSGRIWHCRIPLAPMQGATYYAYSVEGPEPNGRFEWHWFDHDKILFDPYAKSVFFPPAFDRLAAVRPGSNAGKAPLGVLAGDSERFDWQGDHGPMHEADTVIYELHVGGFPSMPTPASRTKRVERLRVWSKESRTCRTWASPW